ncbi:MAG TPA: hypothetical protein EYH35_01745 [Thiotrichaceae bacterium]|nr:hypothetical protein [Thiotrichaceae bacterium]
MTLCINAWLECKSPKIIIYNRQTHDTLAIIKGELLETLLGTGEVCIDDLYSTDPLIIKETIMDLLLIYSRLAINDQIDAMYDSVQRRDTVIPMITPKTKNRRFNPASLLSSLDNLLPSTDNITPLSHA